MKNYKILFSILFTCCIIAYSCEDNNKEDHLSQSMVYIVHNGVQEIIMFETGEPYRYNLSLYKSGAIKSEATVKVNTLSEDELNEYNTLNETSYKLITSECYTLDTYNISFTNDLKDVNRSINIDFDVTKVKALLTNSDLYVLPIKIEDSSIEKNAEKSICIIHPKTEEPILSFQKSGVFINEYNYGQISDLEFDIPISLSIDVNRWNIECEIIEDKNLIEEYNIKNGTEYIALPAGTYIFDKDIIMKENLKESTLSVKINGAKLDAGKFMLPIRLKSSSKFNINQTTSTHILAINIAAPLIDKKSWVIADFNTQEAGGEGPVNGYADCIIDGKNDTFWHSQWQGVMPDLPHYATIDMKEEYTIAQIDLVRRKDNTDTKAGEFWISNDNLKWIKAGEFIPSNTNSPQLYPITATKGRFIKIIITESNHPQQCTSLAEVLVHGY